MADPANQTPVQTAWLAYVGSVRALLVPQVDDRPLDQYLIFRDGVLALVESPRFLSELQKSWPPSGEGPRAEAGNLLLLEVQTFPRAVEVARTTDTTTAEPKSWLSRWLRRAGTVTGSVKDLLESLPPYAKGGLTLFGELVDLFRGKE